MSKKRRIYLYGVGGHADVIRDILQEQGTEIVCTIDDDPEKIAAGHNVLPGVHLNNAEKLNELADPVVIGVGDNRARKLIADRLHVETGIVQHDSAIVSKNATLGEGTVVFHNSVIQTRTRVGRNVIINTSASVDHDCVIGDFAHISPNATLCGNVHVGEGTQIGAGAIVIPGVRVGNWCVIGAGAVVIGNVPDFATAVGNPARIVKVDQ